VVRIALENGSSVARVLLTTEVCISDKPEEEDKEGAGPGMDDDMDMM
jgi:chaperonin GroEL